MFVAGRRSLQGPFFANNILYFSILISGGDCPNYENAKGVEASTTHDGGLESADAAVQAQGAGHQEVHRHPHREGVSRTARRRQRYIQLFSLIIITEKKSIQMLCDKKDILVFFHFFFSSPPLPSAM